MLYQTLSPAIPQGDNCGELKDCVQQVIMDSSRLEGQVAPLTAALIGDAIRLMNSYHSNLIEGHKTSILEIERALNQHYTGDDARVYSQELCAAHVEAERELMASVTSGAITTANIFSDEVLSHIHQVFYSKLPTHHQFTHDKHGFTNIPVSPGQWRGLNVSVRQDMQLGPDYEDLTDLMDQFFSMYSSEEYYGDERVIAVAASHHKLTWLHPFHDGNGRVCRLHSGLALATLGINQANLWSLSRGFSYDKASYMIYLNAADQPPGIDGDTMDLEFSEVHLTDWCLFFLETCLDQIKFMGNLLRLETLDDRIDMYTTALALPAEANRIIKAAFRQGHVQRGEVPTITGLHERSARRVTSLLTDLGILQSESTRAPLMLTLTADTLRYYFPALYDPVVVGR